jgi:hypothetical protein
MGVAAILGQHPHHRPRHLKKSPAPLFHVISQTVRRKLYEGYAWFVAAFRQAAEKLRVGFQRGLTGEDEGPFIESPDTFLDLPLGRI